jgi:hypothetical protein
MAGKGLLYQFGVAILKILVDMSRALCNTDKNNQKEQSNGTILHHG